MENKNLCNKIFSIILCTPQQHHQEPESEPELELEPAKPSSGWVPIAFHDHGHKDNQEREQPQEQPPIKKVRMQVERDHVSDNYKPKPTRVFSEYIERAGTRIRAGSSVGARKHGLRRDSSFNKRVSEYINRAKVRFTAKPSFVDHGN